MAGGLAAFGNLPLKTDANGYLLVAIGGGNFTPDTITLDNTAKDTVIARATAGNLAIYATGVAGATNAIRLMNGTTTASLEYGALAWAGNFLNVGVVTNGGTARVVRLISPATGASVLLAPNGVDAYAFGTSGATIFGGVTSVGKGVPAIYAAGSALATTGAIAALCTMTVGASDGQFEVGGTVDITTATTHAFTMACAYTDPGGIARSATLSFTLVAGGALVTVMTAANGTVPYMGISQRIRVKRTTVITVLTTGTLTTVTYDATANIAQYQNA